MLLKYFYDDALAHASYMVGCQKSNEAIIIDPARNITPYLQAAAAESMRLVGAAETHIHADFVSGARELADRVGAQLYLSDEGDADWKYAFAGEYETQLLKDGDQFKVGNIHFKVLHTPGHTPESISFLLTDTGGGADRPMGIFTGDFVFVGSTGRPDLLEKAAGVAGNARVGAHQMFNSLQRFRDLPDYLQVWPSHGAGSACGKGLGAVPSTTVGYEKLFNPALAIRDEEAFIDYLLADQPEAPRYFAQMKRVNKVGPAVLGQAVKPTPLAITRLAPVLAEGCLVIDTRAPEAFGEGHAPGTLNIPPWYLANWAGWFVDYEAPVFIISPANEANEALRIMREIGVDQIGGVFDADGLASAGCFTETLSHAMPSDVAMQITIGEATLVDVRAQSEWNEGHIPAAKHHFLGRLRETAASLPTDKPIILQCQSGGRSAVAASVLQAAGIKNVMNLAGGINAWQLANLPIVTSAGSLVSAD